VTEQLGPPKLPERREVICGEGGRIRKPICEVSKWKRLPHHSYARIMNSKEVRGAEESGGRGLQGKRRKWLVIGGGLTGSASPLVYITLISETRRRIERRGRKGVAKAELEKHQRHRRERNRRVKRNSFSFDPEDREGKRGVHPL